MTSTGNRAFLDFYAANNIIPVHQDLTDLENHLIRRNYLYQTLGMPPALFRGGDVIEFGPGTGDNAIATSFYGLNKYILVDGNPPSVRELNKRCEKGSIHAKTCKVIESDINAYRDDARYDVVLCEGLIPGQPQPKQFLDHVSSFCAPGGVVVFTTISYVSQLAEFCRRVFRPVIVADKSPFERQVTIASDIFRDHLATFGVSTRPIEDWVSDNILHDWLVSENQVFSVLDAIDIFGDRFQFHSSSPRFLTDDRWYKAVGRDSDTANDLVIQQYHTFSAMLLDYRVKLETINGAGLNKEWVTKLEDFSFQAYRGHLKICRERSYKSLGEFTDPLEGIAASLPPEMTATREGITDFVHGIRKVAAGDTYHKFGAFKSWWGRGQQYASFVRAT